MSLRKLLVTGATGFVGRQVEAACAPDGAFRGWAFRGVPPGTDVRDRSAMQRVVAEISPDAVLHLAAQSFVPRSFEEPRETFEVNLLGTLALLQSLSANQFRGRMVYVSSGDVYGKVPEEALPVDEARVPEPRSPYAVSKIAAEQLCMQWHRTDGLDVMVARPFNHVGPGQDSRFVLPALARQVAAIAAHSREPVIEVGDIDTTRDFTDVRDIVAAYAAMFERGRTGATYVIGSGRELRVRDLLQQLFAIADVAPVIRQDPARLRPVEQRRMCADATLLRRDTGWAPTIPMETTLRDILKDAAN